MTLSEDVLRQIDNRDFIIFDGVCVLCNGWVKFVLRFDTSENFSFVIAQSELGETIYEQLGLKSDDYDTFIIVRNGEMFTKLDGVFALLGAIGWPWKIVSIGKILPKGLKDYMYDRVAKNRYALFGKKDVCMMPTPEIKARFIGA
jgi:predicted DCC family thiol-disulfide oxidoreductase YuxK